jgi:stearoyl-CoA desaturase (delta-9 desaturase)
MHTATPNTGGLALAAAPTRYALTPRPDRSRLWIAYRAVKGTWFIVLIHVGALATVYTGASRLDLLLLLALLYVRGLLVTIGLHRFFSHRSFKTSRPLQFILAFLCCANMQRGPIWWAAIHRHHHRHSDDPDDAHSPVRGGFLWGHCAWVFVTLESPEHGTVRDLTRFPELVWLERLWLVPGFLLAGVCWLVGGWSLLCAGFCLSAVIVMHTAFLVNSLGHLVGSRRYPTADQSRNSFLLAVLTLGDGWHHNHHHYPHSANHGFFWWEIDTSYRVIRLLERVGLVWDVRPVPPHKLHPPGTALPSQVAACAEIPDKREAEFVG